MNTHWIYVGADISEFNWSKVGKTTCGLHTRHTSSQRAGFFIFTAYEIVENNVHEIESKLLNFLDKECEREYHYSTGSKSECFIINPYTMSYLVESFIKHKYPSSVRNESITGELSRYQCPNEIYNKYYKNASEDQFPSELPKNKHQNPFPTNLRCNKNFYYSNNMLKFEEDLGDGYFVDLETGMHGYRDEEGNVEWKE